MVFFQTLKKQWMVKSQCFLLIFLILLHFLLHNQLLDLLLYAFLHYQLICHLHHEYVLIVVFYFQEQDLLCMHQLFHHTLYHDVMLQHQYYLLELMIFQGFLYVYLNVLLNQYQDLQKYNLDHLLNQHVHDALLDIFLL